jgi:hypothetical protein
VNSGLANLASPSQEDPDHLIPLAKSEFLRPPAFYFPQVGSRLAMVGIVFEPYYT